MFLLPTFSYGRRFCNQSKTQISYWQRYWTFSSYIQPYCHYILQGSWTFSKVKFKHFQSIFKVHFQAFPAPYSCGKLYSKSIKLSSIRIVSLSKKWTIQIEIYYINATKISNSFKHFIHNPSTLNFKHFQEFPAPVRTPTLSVKIVEKNLKMRYSDLRSPRWWNDG